MKYVIYLSILGVKKIFKSKINKECDKGKHIKIPIQNPDKNSIDSIFYSYIIQHKKYDFYVIKCEFKLVLNDNQNCQFPILKRRVLGRIFWEK